MTTRMNIAWLEVSAALDEHRELITRSPHSRYPVCDGNLDNVLGIVEAQHLLTAVLQGEQPDRLRIRQQLDELTAFTPEQRIDQRIEKYSAMGRYEIKVEPEKSPEPEKR